MSKANPKYSLDDVFDFIVSYKTMNNGNSPTLRQIMKGVGCASTSYTHFLVNKLQGSGRLQKTGRVNSLAVPGYVFIEQSTIDNLKMQVEQLKTGAPLTQ